MSAYLQRLVRPRSAAVAGPQAAPVAHGPLGLQEIETFREAQSMPVAGAPRQADLPVARADGRVDASDAIGQVLRWVAAPHEDVGAPRPQAASIRGRALQAGASSARPLLAVPGPLRPQSMYPSTLPAPRGSVLAQFPADTPSTLAEPTQRVPGVRSFPEAVASRALPVPDIAPETGVRPAASPLRLQLAASNAEHVHHATPRQGNNRKAGHPIATRRTGTGDTVSVHVGTLELRVQAPSPAPPPATAIAPPPAARPRGPSAEPMRFALGRHHLRWS